MSVCKCLHTLKTPSFHPRPQLLVFRTTPALEKVLDEHEKDIKRRSNATVPSLCPSAKLLRTLS